MELNYYKIKKKQTLGNFVKIFEKKKIDNIEIAVKLDIKKKLQGIITLGDLRKIVENKPSFNDDISKFINKKVLTVQEKDLNNNLYQLILNKNKNKINFKHLVILDNKKKFKRILDFEKIVNNFNFKKICVVGLGHIGLPLAIYLLNKFDNIIGLDLNKKKISDIRKGKIDFYEKNFDGLLNQAIKKKKLLLTSSYKRAKSEIYIICIGTNLNNNKINNNNIIGVAKRLAKIIKKNDVVVLRGTMQVEGSKLIFLQNILKNTKLICGIDFYFGYIPERLIEGNALEELQTLPQLIAGYSSECLIKIKNFAAKVFSSVIELKNIEEGEIIKLASNSYRDLNFSFSNELTRIANNYNLSGHDTIRKANFGYERNSIAKPSVGVGGFCLPKDPILFSKKLGKTEGYLLGKYSRFINENSTKLFCDLITKKINDIKKKSKKVLILGLAFKGLPETTDIRNSPSIEICKYLTRKKINYDAYDVMIKKIDFKNIKIKTISKIKNINDYELIILSNNNPKYVSIIENYLKYNSKKIKKKIFDCCDMLNQEFIKNLNWEYYKI
jgi:UDP-N-acetyl-D-mannosaminuronic acid dehydrogenase